LMSRYMKFSLGCLPGKPLSSRRIAVIGAGPAGLVAAGFLACSGCEVYVYDKLPEPGGLMLFAIPDDRIDPARVRGGVRELSEVYGVNFITRTKVINGSGVGDEGDELIKDKVNFLDIVEGYDVTLIATGAWRSRRLGIPGEELGNVFTALDILFRIKAFRLGYLPAEGVPNLSGKRVAVIGAGLSAVDSASEALRAGASEVYLLYRRTIREAPAGEGEIKNLINRGVKWVELVAPKRILGSGGVVSSIELVRCRLGSPDESGRPRPEPIPGSEFVINVDVVINSTGEVPTPPTFNESVGIKLDRWGRIIVNEKHMTSREGVFAAGDVVLGPSRIGHAIRDGLSTARSIASYLLQRG